MCIPAYVSSYDSGSAASGIPVEKKTMFIKRDDMFKEKFYVGYVCVGKYFSIIILELENNHF